MLVPSINFNQKVSSTSHILGLGGIVKDFDPSIIHLQSHLNTTAISTIRIAKKLSIPVVTTIHGVSAKINPLWDFGQFVYLNTFCRYFVFKMSTRVICLTNSNAQDLLRLGCSPDKLSIIPNGVDLSIFKPACDIKSNNLVVWHGWLVPNKGLEYLIEALYFVINNGCPSIKLFLIGDGPLKKYLINLVNRLHLNSNVVFVGKLALNEIPKYLQQANVYVYPSLREGMPWALLEAMACGVPIVGSDIPGIRDVITHGKNGLLVPPKDSLALAKAIMSLMVDSDLRYQLGHKGWELAVKEYDWAKICNKVEEIYHDALLSNS